jgi:hypothetical protein
MIASSDGRNIGINQTIAINGPPGYFSWRKHVSMADTEAPNTSASTTITRLKPLKQRLAIAAHRREAFTYCSSIPILYH